MTQPKTELETLETFMSKKRNIITNQQKQSVFGATVILNVKAMMIEIKYYQLKNTLNKIRLYLENIINDLTTSVT